MSRTISTNYLNGLQLTATSDSPVSIVPGVSITNSGGIALFLTQGAWSLTNAGLIQGTDLAANAGAGLYLQIATLPGLSQLTLTNQSTGNISGNEFGVRIAGTASIDNQGSISGTTRDGIRVADGGTIVNEATASIVGNVYGVLIYGGLGSVTNQSAITGATKDGVVLLAGGSVANSTSAASIAGGSDGVFIQGGAGSVANQGVIAGTASDGVVLLAGGTVGNQISASISGNYVGVDVGGGLGTVNNQGTIKNQAAFTNQTFVFGGVLLGGGGSVTNSTAAAIRGTFYGIWAAGTVATTVVNDGSISGSATAAGRGVALLDGGAVTNNANGTITGGLFGVRLSNATGTVTNAGSISATQTAGGASILLGSGGSVTNTLGGKIIGGYSGIRVLNAAGTVTNAGSIASNGPSVAAAIDFGAGGSVTNVGGGTVTAGIYGIRVVGAAGSVTNAGFISSSQTSFGAAVALVAGGSVTNSAGGTISGAYYGIRVLNAAGAVANSGFISNSQTTIGAGVELVAGGSVTNSLGGKIGGGIYGIRVRNAAGTVTNAGSISSSQTSIGAGVGLLAGGSVTNSAGGLISAPWIGVKIGQAGTNTGGTFVNQGSVFAGDIKGDGAAVWVHGPGVVINDTTGAIDGGPLNGTAAGGFGIVAYDRMTVINRGIIGGSRAIDDANLGFGNLVEMAPGASFGGIVQGAQAATDAGLATLELLSGSSAGTISGFGPKYQNFGHVVIDSGARWNLGGTVASSSTVALAPGGGESLTFANPGAMKGLITGFGTGETLMLGGITDATGATLASGNVLTINQSGAGTLLALDFDPSQTFNAQNFGQVLDGNGNPIAVTFACFAAGTLIRTEHGKREVETLRQGMRVLTHRGDPAEIIWIGHRAIDCDRHPDPAAVCPVRIRAGAFGQGLPSRDLLLSPDHAVFVDNMLIPIRCLINGGTIRREAVAEVTYYHVELPEHDVILAEDLPVESYLDTGDRSNFANGGGPVRLFPDFSARMWEMAGCAPLVMTGPALERVRQELSRRALVVSGSGGMPASTPAPPWTGPTNRYTYY